jgi:hypothetical protein
MPRPDASFGVDYPIVDARLDPCCSLGKQTEDTGAVMAPLYLARIEDLGPGDFVKVDCAACRHTALLAPAFLDRLGLRPRTKVLDL